jgi:hypothetical protein
LDSLLGDNISKEVEGILMEPALFDLSCAGSFAQSLEDLAHMLWVFVFVLGKHHDVVKIGHTGAVDVLPQDVVHKVLKGSRCIARAEGHQEVFVVTISCPKGSFPLLSFSHADLLECIS